MDNIKKIIDEVDIVECVSNFLDLSKKGKNYICSCPFHSDNTPSFFVNSRLGRFKCFGCGVSGNVINFYMRIKNIRFLDAILELSKKYNIDLKLSEKKNNVIYDIILKCSEKFVRDLNDIALNYLIKKRRLSLEVIKNFDLGYSTKSSIFDYLISIGYKEDDILKSGMIRNKKYNFFSERIMFPISDINNKIVGFGARDIDGKLPKYLNSSESYIFKKREILYGFDKEAIRSSKYVIIVEGYIDLLILHSFNFKNSVAVLGLSLSDFQIKTIKRYCNNVVFLFDNDDSGRKSIFSNLFKFLSFDVKVKIGNLKDCKDPDEFFQKYTVDDFNDLIKQSLNGIDFLINYLSEKYDIKNNEDKKMFLKEISPFFDFVKNIVERDLAIKKISDFLNINENLLDRFFVKKNKEVFENFYSYDMFSLLEKETIELCVNNNTALEFFSTNKFEHSNPLFNEIFERLSFSKDRLNDLKKYLIQYGVDVLIDFNNFKVDFDEILKFWYLNEKNFKLKSLKSDVKNDEDKLKLVKRYYNILSSGGEYDKKEK